MIFEENEDSEDDIKLTDEEKENLKEFNLQWAKKLKTKIRAELNKEKQKIIIDIINNYQPGVDKKLDKIMDEINQTIEGKYKMACSGLESLSEKDKEKILNDISLLNIIDKYFEDDTD